MNRWFTIMAVLLLGAVQPVQCQHHSKYVKKVDSLTQLLSGELSPQQRVLELCQLSSVHLGNANDSALAVADRALALAMRAKDAPGQIRAMRFRADALYRLGKRDEAMALYRAALNIRTSAADDVFRGYLFRQLAIGHYHLADYDSALYLFHRALEIFDADSLKGDRAVVLNNIGNVYYFTNKDRAIDYYEQSLAIHKELNEPEGMAMQYGNIGLLLILKKDTAKAVEYSERSLAINEGLGIKLSIATSLVNLAHAYESFGMYERAIPLAERSLELRKEMNDLRGIAISTIMLGSIHADKGDCEKAIPILVEGAALIEKQGLRSYHWETLNTLAHCHVKRGELAEAVRLFPRVIAIKDSIYQEESTEQMAKIEGLYQAQKDGKVRLLEQQSEINELQLKRRTAYLAAATVVTFVLGLMFLAIYFAYRAKSRVNAQLEFQNTLINEQKLEVERQKAVVDLRNHEMMQSLDYARRLQEAVMPGKDALKELFPESFLLFLPRDVVSGDFYWMARHKGIHYLAVGDCTGHGVPGAMLSVIGLNSLNRCISDLGLTRPKDVLTQMTVDLLLTFEGSGDQVRDGMDITLCAIDTVNMQVTYAGANNPLWLARQGQMTIVKGDRRAVGFHDRAMQFSQHEMKLQQEDVIYLFSDGFQDQMGGPEGKKYMTRRFRELLLANSPLTMEEQYRKLMEEFTAWRGPNEQTDDVCVLGIRIG